MTLTVNKVEGSVVLAGGTADIDMIVGEPGDTPTLIDLFGASNDPDPSENTESLRHEIVRPPSGRIEGSTEFTSDAPFTVDVTFTENGSEHLYRGTAPAADMHDGNTVRMHLNRVNG